MMKILRYLVLLLLLSTEIKAQNYDESKVPEYTLPDLLKTSANVKITTASSWEKSRRPEVLKLFEDNVYGQMPKKFDGIKFNVVNDDKMAMEGRAHLKQVQIVVTNSGKSVKINLTLFTPNERKNRSAVFLLINNRPLDNTDPTRKKKSEFWPAEMVIDSGYAIASFYVFDAAPDNNEHYREGVLRLYPDQLSAGNGMKAIGAWAWAASRVMDYFEKDKDIDPAKVFVVGHSRGGKAALWTGAQDKRFAMVFANCSGNTGAALARRQYGETVKRINTTFPYWFCDNYQQYNDNVDRLPLDQHMLIALIAPRPLYTTNASKDLWADPKGSFLSLKEAEKVYGLYGKKSTLGKEPPEVGEAIFNSQLGYHIREGVHNLTIFDWKNFIEFANYHHFKG